MLQNFKPGLAQEIHWEDSMGHQWVEVVFGMDDYDALLNHSRMEFGKVIDTDNLYSERNHMLALKLNPGRPSKETLDSYNDNVYINVSVDNAYASITEIKEYEVKGEVTEL